MSYKVDFYTLAKMNDEETGNIRQSTGHCFTDAEIDEIPSVLNKYLEPKKQVAVILKIENLNGFVLSHNHHINK
jgi:hypothetical protein